MAERGFLFELKALDETGTFSGLASTYGTKDLGGDVVEHGAFTATLAEKGQERPLLWAHDTAEPIGLGVLADSAAGLKIEGTLDLDTQAGRDAYSRLKKRIVRGLSIGYRSVKDTVKDGIRHLHQIDLYEVSLTVFPMNPAAQVQRIKGQLTSVRDFEKWLRDAGGFSKAEATRLASHGWRGLGGAAESEDDESVAEVLAWLREQKALFARDHNGARYWAK